jgi:hypothetical protein
MISWAFMVDAAGVDEGRRSYSGSNGLLEVLLTWPSL